MDIDILLGKTLEVAETPGLESFDPRFTDISSIVQDGDFTQAAVMAEEVLKEGIYDIRIIGYFLYGVFVEQGAAALAPVFGALAEIFTDNWEAVGPRKNIEKHAQNTLKWFITQLTKKLEYEENKKEGAWNAWVEQVDHDTVQLAIDNLDACRKSIGRTLEDAAGPVLESLAKVKDWLSSFYKLVYCEPEAEAVLEAGVDEGGQNQGGQELTAKGGASVMFGLGGDMVAEGSFRLQELINKLKAFESLVQAQKFSLAALVADDINGIVADFDPKIYFPKIFARFSYLFARNISGLIACEQYKGTVEWMAWQELYKVDLAGFVNFDGEVEFTMVSGGSQGQEENESESYPSDGTETDEEYGSNDDD